MISVCAYCKKKLGEKPPYEDKSVSYGICSECEKKEMAKLQQIGDEEDRRVEN